jgi:hypothetical protein
MRQYQPPVKMDAVFAVLSLFQLSPSDLVSMVYKFADWVRVGGYAALCVLPSTALSPKKVIYDPTWDAVWMMEKEWMGSLTNESFFSEDGWVRILRQAGFVLEVQPVSYLFSPIGDNHIPEAHYCIVARRFEECPLLGPFPLPSAERLTGPYTTGVKLLDQQQLVSVDLHNFVKRFGEKDVFVLNESDKGGTDAFKPTSTDTNP